MVSAVDPGLENGAGQRSSEMSAVLVPLLAQLAADGLPTQLLFGKHWRDRPRLCVQEIYRAATVPIVTAR
jgi:hypothetical protein